MLELESFGLNQSDLKIYFGLEVSFRIDRAATETGDRRH